METMGNDVPKTANDFKGVKGGDPSRHPKKVSVSYKCPTCGKKVDAVISEGKATPKGPCQKCLDVVNVLQSKAHEEEVRRRINAREAYVASLPTRSDEEYADLTAYLAQLPHMMCSSCKENLPVGIPDADYIGDDPYKTNSVKFVQFTKNPFLLEVYGEVQWEWLCNCCEYDSHMSV